jgi:hypothetical protein
MQRGLRRRIAGSHHHNMLVAAKLRFARACAVIDPSAEQAILLRQTEAPILDARRADRHAGNNLGPIVEIDDTLADAELAANASAVNQDLRAELIGLLPCPLSQLCAAYPRRET